MKNGLFILILILTILSVFVYADEQLDAEMLKFAEEKRELFRNSEIMGLLEKFRNRNLDSQGKVVLFELLVNQAIFKQKNSYIEDESLLDILLTALEKSNCDAIRKVSAKILSEKALDADIDSKSKRIYAALNLKDLFLIAGRNDGLREYSDFLTLIGRLNNLSSEEKNIIFNCPDIPAFIKAKLGDGQAEETLVKGFMAEKEYHRKSSYAEQLGYIASPLSIKALLCELSSPVKIEWSYGEVSIRLNIINALRLALPNEKIFAQPLETLSSGKFSPSPEREKARREYAEQLNIWSLKHYNMTVWNPDTVWFMYSYDTPIINRQ